MFGSHVLDSSRLERCPFIDDRCPVIYFIYINSYYKEPTSRCGDTLLLLFSGRRKLQMETRWAFVVRQYLPSMSAHRRGGSIELCFRRPCGLSALKSFVLGTGQQETTVGKLTPNDAAASATAVHTRTPVPSPAVLRVTPPRLSTKPLDERHCSLRLSLLKSVYISLRHSLPIYHDRFS